MCINCDQESLEPQWWLKCGQGMIGTASELPEHALPPKLELTNLWLPTFQEMCQ